MKKNIKNSKFVFAFLLCLCLSLFVACTGISSGSSESEESSTVSGSDSSQSVEEESQDEVSDSNEADASSENFSDERQSEEENASEEESLSEEESSSEDEGQSETESESESQPSQGEGEEDDDDDYQTVLIEEFLSSDTFEQFVMLKGTVTRIVDDIEGEFVLTDGSGQVEIYGLRANKMSKNVGDLSGLGIEVGDTVIISAKLSEERFVNDSYLVCDKTVSEDKIFTVQSASEYVELVDRINSGEVENNIHIHLGADIDMSGIEYHPIEEFRGVFDGNGHTISNITFALEGASLNVTDGNWVDYGITAIGLIGSAYDVTVKDLNIVNAVFDCQTSGEIFAGTLVGYAVGVVIEDCSISVVMNVLIEHQGVQEHNISGVAGVIGYSLGAYTQGVTVNCYIDYTANSYEAFVGAMLGVGNVVIQDCIIELDIKFTGTVYGHTGAIIGMERTPEGIILASIFDSAVRGTVEINNGRGYAWGLVGQGYFYHPTNGDVMEVEEYNEVDVTYIRQK